MSEKRKILKKWAIDHNLKHKDIAAKLGITRQHWTNIVNGKSDPSYDLLEKFSKAFDVNNIYELFKKEA